jgi:hypothetical protein
MQVFLEAGNMTRSSFTTWYSSASNIRLTIRFFLNVIPPYLLLIPLSPV